MIPETVPHKQRRRYRLLPTSRAALVAAIHRHEPWDTATGPRTFEGKMISRLNATQHGVYGRVAALAILQDPTGFKAVMRQFRQMTAAPRAPGPPEPGPV